MYCWVDPKLVGTIYFFDNTKKMEEAHIEWGPSFLWPASHVDVGKRIYNYFDECFVPFYQCPFTRLKFRLPFSGYKMGLFRCMNIAPS